MIRKLCYELYKLDWKNSHITVEKEAKSIKDYFDGLIDSDAEYTYNDYLEEFGYNEELYACYDEFLDNEYQDEEYICGLLNNEKFIDMYRKDKYERESKLRLTFDITLYGKVYDTLVGILGYKQDCFLSDNCIEIKREDFESIKSILFDVNFKEL
ncbi:MAG: hypothetical protein IJA34_00620 [Lachnospiraceae bacterium]|nr:hypothetical protein [Lachnospiraceae bacterium]